METQWDPEAHPFHDLFIFAWDLLGGLVVILLFLFVIGWIFTMFYNAVFDDGGFHPPKSRRPRALRGEDQK